ncbi:MAG: putative rane protein [Gemmatimonadetes bacterium]|nr:putative rane protein [Gemmatimonadota bacterium]
MPPDRGGASRAALLVVLLAGAIRLCFAALIPLFPDEAYYWDWSRHLAAGYFDHPPALAWLVAGGTSLFGDTPFGVRLLPVLAGIVATALLVDLTARAFGDAAARSAAILISVLPLAAAGLVLATPDAPLLCAVSLGMWAVVRALLAPLRSRASLGWWSVAGVALGLAFSSKYTSILLPVGLTIAVLWHPALRARLREPGPWVACLLATLVFIPVLRWNAAHHWISFAFQLGHGLGAPKGSALKRELDLVGGQVGLVSPILFVLLAIVSVRALRRASHDVDAALATIAAFTFLFFAWSATRRSVEANWPAPAYLAAVPLLAAAMARGEWRRSARWGTGLAAAMSLAVYVHAAWGVLPLAARKDPLARSAGWDSLAAAAMRESRALAPAHAWLGGDRYQETSELALHAPGHPTTFAANIGGRANQYDLWPTFAATARSGDALILALDDGTDVHPTAARLAPYFTAMRAGARVPLMRGRDTVAVRRLWVLEGWRGAWPAR